MQRNTCMHRLAYTHTYIHSYTRPSIMHKFTARNKQNRHQILQHHMILAQARESRGLVIGHRITAQDKQSLHQKYSPYTHTRTTHHTHIRARLTIHTYAHTTSHGIWDPSARQTKKRQKNNTHIHTYTQTTSHRTQDPSGKPTKRTTTTTTTKTWPHKSRTSMGL
jgi:hypothetical protein